MTEVKHFAKRLLMKRMLERGIVSQSSQEAEWLRNKRPHEAIVTCRIQKASDVVRHELEDSLKSGPVGHCKDCCLQCKMQCCDQIMKHGDKSR